MSLKENIDKLIEYTHEADIKPRLGELEYKINQLMFEVNYFISYNELNLKSDIGLNFDETKKIYILNLTTQNKE